MAEKVSEDVIHVIQLKKQCYTCQYTENHVEDVLGISNLNCGPYNAPNLDYLQGKLRKVELKSFFVIWDHHWPATLLFVSRSFK